MVGIGKLQRAVKHIFIWIIFLSHLQFYFKRVIKWKNYYRLTVDGSTRMQFQPFTDRIK